MTILSKANEEAVDASSITLQLTPRVGNKSGSQLSLHDKNMVNRNLGACRYATLPVSYILFILQS